MLARNHLDINVGISLWGSHHEQLLIRLNNPFRTMSKLTRDKPSNERRALSTNCTEYFNPEYTWTRKFLSGNIENIIQRNAENLRQFEKEFGKIDLIHAHVTYPAGYIAMHLASVHKVPYVISEHMTPFPFPTFNSVERDLNKWLKGPLLKSSAIIAVSTFLTEKINSFSKKEALTYPNFIDEETFEPKERKTPSTGKLLSVGRLEEQKNHANLLRAVKILIEQNLDVTLTIAGSGRLEKSLKQMCDQLAITNSINWAGEMDRVQIRHLLQENDMMILSSDHENNPVALIEALASGKPIISTACRGPEDIVHSKNGLLATVSDPEDLARQIMNLIENYDQYDPKVIRKDFEKRFSSKVITPKIVDLYKKVIAEHRG